MRWFPAVLVAVVSCLAFATLGCGGSSTSDASGGSGGSGGSGASGGNGATGGSGGTTPTEVLCDGSDAIRFLYRSAGGYVEQSYGFTNPHGHSFLAVTGKCEAFAGNDYMSGIFTLTLSETQAAQLSKDVGRDQITGWSKYPDQQSCPDAGSVSISDGKNQAWCSCGCDPGVPPGIEVALKKASTWLDTVFDQGAALTGPVAVAAMPDGNPIPGQTPLAWPLAWPVSSLPSAYDTTTGKQVTDAGEASQLRKLRSDTLAALSYASYILVVDAAAAPFEVYVRDELPPTVEAALDAME